MPEGREKMAGYGSFADVINVLEGAVSRDDYVVGDSFTAADVYLGSQVGWGMMFGSIEKRPAFEQYWERIGMRPAALRAREIDDALIAQHKQASTAGEIPLALVASALIADHQSALSQEILDIPVA